MIKFEGEHLLPGQLGHFFVILAFVASLLSTLAYFFASRQKDTTLQISWIRYARVAFLVQLVSIVLVFAVIFYICSHHYFEYMYAYKHASRELESKYLLACIWEGQEGSFLLWSIWHAVLGSVIILRGREWEAPVMSVISFAQFFLLLMILGVYFFGIRIGNSPFTLTRNEINGPIFSRPDYLNFIKDGVGLNVLLRNYWMVIHPPVLFLGFASTIVPFAYAYAALQRRVYSDWIKPALPWALFSTCVLGVGIWMGGKWAYESLSFGGYWAWDPVENASLVPWMIMVSAVHTMVIFKSTGHSLKAGFIFSILSFVFVLYSTFLTRTGVLSETSVHAFTLDKETVTVTYTMLLLYMAAFTIPALVMYFINARHIPAQATEEKSNSREFWMFIGSLVFFLAAVFIIAKTSTPVINKLFNTQIAPPDKVEISYNKVLIPVTVIIALLTAIAQYFKYKTTPAAYTFKKLAIPTVLSIIITVLIGIFAPITYYKEGPGYLGAIYGALFATIYAVVANAAYIWTGLNGKLKGAGGSITHVGFALLLAGILISASNKKVISSSTVNGINLPAGTDPMTRQQDDPTENLTLPRQVPTRMGPYEVTYLKDSAGNEKGRKFYELSFIKKDPVTKEIQEQFILKPDVYMMKDNNMSSNPDTRNYLTKDVFTYLSFAANDKNLDTAQFHITEMNEGDTAFYSKGIVVLNKVIRNPNNARYHFSPDDAALMADITVISKDSMHYPAMPLIQVDSLGIKNTDDTLYAQNIYLRFAGVTDGKKIKVGIKESDRIIDFITLKAYIFPWINLVWLGLIIMAIGIILSMLRRMSLPALWNAVILVVSAAALFYMFLFANN
ncbi:MAG: cytochrome c biogenesis protein CcsA [Ferruginibacter sp.]